MKQYFFILWMAVFAQVNAQTSFTATVNKNKLTVNDRFSLSFTLTNGDGKDLKLPGLEDFYILGGPNQSSQFQSMNGRTSKSISYNYILQPRSVGKFTIGSASVRSGSETYTTQPVTIEVTEKTAGQSGTNDQKGSDGSTDIDAYVQENFFLRAEVSDREIYRGEQTTVVFKLYRLRNSAIAEFQTTGMNKVPKFNGFYSQDVDMSNVQPGFETLNGKQYIVYLVKKSILTAQQSGDLEIDPFSMDAVLSVRTKSNKSNDPFRDIFGDDFPDPFSSNYERVRATVTSPTVKVKVNELPPNKPSDFNGAVGSFTMKTELSATETKTDEPLTYRIVITGTGNLDLFEAPQLNLPPGWETYEPKISGTGNSRTYEYLLIPRSPGEFTIPAHTWSYLDNNKKQYVTLTSQAYDVKVEAGPGYTGTGTVSGVNKEDIELLNKDIRYIHKQSPEFEQGEPQMNTAIFYTAAGLPFLLGIFIFLFSAKRNKLEKDVAGLRNRRANSVAGKRLKLAKTFLAKNDSKAFYNEVVRALWGFISDKFAIPQSTLSRENIVMHLQANKISEAVQKDVLELLDKCELALFAPQLAAGSLQETYTKAIDVISELENEIKG